MRRKERGASLLRWKDKHKAFLLCISSVGFWRRNKHMANQAWRGVTDRGKKLPAWCTYMLLPAPKRKALQGFPSNKVQSASLQSVNKSLGCDWVMQVRARVGEMEMRPYLICGKPTALNQYRPERERETVSELHATMCPYLIHEGVKVGPILKVDLHCLAHDEGWTYQMS